MDFRRLAGSWLFICALVLSGCGSDTPAAAEERTAEVTASGPFGGIPRDRLYGASAAENLWTPRYELEVPSLPDGWNGVQIAILTDFHLGYWPENQAVAGEAVKRAVESGVEIVALLGDYVNGESDIPALREVLAPLRGTHTVAVLGDRDVRSDSLAAHITAALEDNGVIVLRNSSLGIELRGDTAWIAGLDPEVLNEDSGTQQYILATLGHSGRTPILLSHVPSLAIRAPEGRFPLVLSGNTFCGQVEIPIAARLSWLASEALPGGEIESTEKAFRVQGSDVLVSCGLGFGFVPIRFGAAPEIPIVTLRSGAVTPDSVAVPAGAVPDSLIESYQGGA